MVKGGNMKKLMTTQCKPGGGYYYTNYLQKGGVI